eukprot:TRINITY_DN6934_c1_g3_i2.p1 TRINITY_DN6934_c1_g3~~TRINITY_DN6934_c1_g3_i2.p1  ORF type:complete len:121 (+),score=23.06 TRINITY_DN6934_c1_g3_i2:349-711(+)
MHAQMHEAGAINALDSFLTSSSSSSSSSSVSTSDPPRTILSTYGSGVFIQLADMNGMFSSSSSSRNVFHNIPHLCPLPLRSSPLAWCDDDDKDYSWQLHLCALSAELMSIASRQYLQYGS